jgi:hypothetical protein
MTNTNTHGATSSSSGSTINLGEMINDLEASFRQNMTKLTEWADQAREVIHEKPGAIVSSLAIAGFMTGALIRKPDPIASTGPLKMAPKHHPALDPLIIFLGTAILGFAFGPKLMDAEARASSSSSSSSSGGKSPQGPSPTRATEHTH